MVIWSISCCNGSNIWPSHLLHPHNYRQKTLSYPPGFNMETRSHKKSTVFDISVISTSSKHDSIKYHSSIITPTRTSSGGGSYLTLKRLDRNVPRKHTNYSLVNNILTPQGIVTICPIPHFLHQRKNSQSICYLIPQGHPHHLIIW